METKKKRVITKPLSELQKNSLNHGRALYYFNGLIQRMKHPAYDVRALISYDQLVTLDVAAGVLRNMRNEVIRSLQVQRANILEYEVRIGKRCANCGTAGSKIKLIEQGAGPYALCKECGHSWQVNNK